MSEEQTPEEIEKWRQHFLHVAEVTALDWDSGHSITNDALVAKGLTRTEGLLVAILRELCIVNNAIRQSAAELGPMQKKVLEQMSKDVDEHQKSEDWKEPEA